MFRKILEICKRIGRNHSGRAVLPLAALAVLVVGLALPSRASAQSAEAKADTAGTAPARALDAKGVEERLGDLEAYMNNGARVAKESKVAGPGPPVFEPELSTSCDSSGFVTAPESRRVACPARWMQLEIWPQLWDER